MTKSLRIRQAATLAVAAASLIFVAGCSGGSENPQGYTKKDFEKSPPPPQYRGPGQPGGPQSGPVSVPPNIANGGGANAGGTTGTTGG